MNVYSGNIKSSASKRTINCPDDSSIPVLSAEGSPKFLEWLIILTFLANFFNIFGVWSVEQSSTTTISKFWLSILFWRADLIALSTYSSQLKTGINMGAD